MDKQIKRQIILENYEHPFHKIDKSKEDFIKIKAANPSCIDDITLFIKFDQDIIKDLYFSGEACVISTSVTSILIKNLIGKTINEALNIINNYEQMVKEQKYNQETIKDLIVYEEIYKQPNRINCTLLPTREIKKVLEDRNDN